MNKILLVDDHSDIRRLIKLSLGKTFEIFEAEDGATALEIATLHKPDVVVLDVMLPNTDGISLCRNLRSRKITTPIIMVTAKDAISDKVKGLDSGADDYLTKPFAFEELLARIRALLRKRDGQSATKLKVDDLELDLLAHKVTRGSKEIVLTAKEYALLEYLMRNPGVVVSRTMISEHVWDINFDTDTNVIDVYINYLRRKIDDGFKKSLIYTMRGRGYILKE